MAREINVTDSWQGITQTDASPSDCCCGHCVGARQACFFSHGPGRPAASGGKGVIIHPPARALRVARQRPPPGRRARSRQAHQRTVTVSDRPATMRSQPDGPVRPARPAVESDWPGLEPGVMQARSESRSRPLGSHGGRPAATPVDPDSRDSARPSEFP
jgi:hypothetical protein